MHHHTLHTHTNHTQQSQKQHESREKNDTATMRHKDMCYSDEDCIYCHPDRQPYREAEAIQKTLTSEYSTEGVKECTKDWKKNSPNYECQHLCQATTETPKRKDVTSRKTFNTNKWFRKCINSWSELDKENCKGATKKDEDEHKTFVMICAPCMSGRWEVVNPTNGKQRRWI
eukprot:scaffold211380_cov43-Attheya_sp.AAC.1